ncbi:MAG: DUF1573 domain-containing protein [Phycisphaerales bacterium JB039]
MGRIALTCCLIALGLTGLAAPAAAQEGAGEQAPRPSGRIKVDSLEHDFGHHLALDPTVIDLVPVRNVGDGPLTVTAVRTTCGCVVGKMKDAEGGEPVVIPAGESRDLELRLNPAGWGTDKSKPVIITVESDDASSPQVRIRMEATITRAIQLDPFPVAFGDSPKATPKEIILTVTGRNEDFEAYAATVAGTDAFKIEVLDTETVERDGKSVGQTRIRVSLLPATPVGFHQGLITVRSTDRSRRLTSVAVTANVTGDLAFDTMRIPAGSVKAGESTEQTFRLTHAKGKPFKILKVEELDHDDKVLPAPTVKITPLPEEEGAGYQIVATIVAQRESIGRLEGYFVFTTDVPLEEKVRVRYAGRQLPADDAGGSDAP